MHTVAPARAISLSQPTWFVALCMRGELTELGGGNHFTPYVLSLSGVPEITDEDLARKEPELAVLSALGHANDPDTDKSARTALMAQMASIGLDVQRSALYCDLVLNSLPEVARRALSTMDTKKSVELDGIAKRVLTAKTLEKALGVSDTTTQARRPRNMTLQS